MTVRPILLLVGCLIACDRGDAPDGIDRETFVSTYIELRRATMGGSMDSVTRDSILRTHGTTEADLRAYVAARSDDPDALAETWREITDSIAARDSASAEPDTL